jgi:hypothetical protein
MAEASDALLQCTSRPAREPTRAGLLPFLTATLSSFRAATARQKAPAVIPDQRAAAWRSARSARPCRSFAGSASAAACTAWSATPAPPRPPATATATCTKASTSSPTLADQRHIDAGIGIHVPVRRPKGRSEQALHADTRTTNSLIRGIRALGERAASEPEQRWRTLQRITISPSRIGDIARAALVLNGIWK